jgi:MFS family permease
MWVRPQRGDVNRADRDRVTLAGVVFAVMLAQVLLYPGIPDLVEALGADVAFDASQWFLAAEFAAFVAFAGVWGVASDALGRRGPLVAAGAVGGAAGYLALAALPAVAAAPFVVVLALRVLQGAMTVGALSLAMTALMDLPGGHGRNMGAAGIAIGLGVALGAPLGGQLTARHPLAPLVVAGALLGSVGLAVLLVAERVPGDDDRSAAAVLGAVAAAPALAIPYAFGFVDRLTAGFFALVGTFYLRETFALGAAETGLTLALFFGPFALLQYPFGAMSDRVGRRIPVVGGSVVYGLALVTVGATEGLLATRVAMVGLGVLGALVAPATMALVTDIAGEGTRGLAMSGFNVAGSLGFLVGIVAGGTVADASGYLAAFVVVGALEVLVAAVALGPLLLIDLPAPDGVGRR